MSALIDRPYYEVVTGHSVPEGKDTDFTTLAGIASDLVRDYCHRPDWTEATAPQAAKVSTARLVDSVLYGSDQTGATKAEQVGDYRHEYAVASTPYGRGGPMDIGLVAPDLDTVRLKSRSVVSPQELFTTDESDENYEVMSP